METLIRYRKDEATGEFIPLVIEFEGDYIAYQGGEVHFSFTDIKLGQVEGSDYFGYQWTCSYANLPDGEFDYDYGHWTLLSRKYDTLDEATKALWADLDDKARYESVLNKVTDGEQTLDDLGIFSE